MWQGANIFTPSSQGVKLITFLAISDRLFLLFDEQPECGSFNQRRN
ncbi:Uncharacterised protein [Pragia fontium]|uniref:Uncharacterized protein n=1 Tax=Pragia fontium DSM 5563 = ATCC 49100 TaxID=1122977 RepID=A0AAJ4WD69_9GAMM|nr:hypothetical protein SAMN02745723_11446 [Pragia fontium DSM 5563 = ATCC 49100]SUB84146.1 Uncharacterised protein [Pragia fontium]VEJ57038.1 Uncharacterised protein [Pragia fontium]